MARLRDSVASRPEKISRLYLAEKADMDHSLFLCVFVSQCMPITTKAHRYKGYGIQNDSNLAAQAPIKDTKES